ncbi:MAG: LexA family transcriptional regulator, partial [Ruminococcus sp.]|nr:LexA family transcriptional regulator [Ruminococcus sp.]
EKYIWLKHYYKETQIKIKSYFDRLPEKEKSTSLLDDQLKYYKELPEREQQRLIKQTLAYEEVYKEQSETRIIEVETPMIEIRHSYYKVSAGTGYDLNDDNQWDTIEIPDTPEAQHADFALTISGDSMEPVYYDGDIVLIKSQPAVDSGEIGIFIIENNGFIKKYGGDKLISLNAVYDDIMFSDYAPEDIRCVGLVIGRV